MRQIIDSMIVVDIFQFLLILGLAIYNCITFFRLNRIESKLKNNTVKVYNQFEQ